MNHRSKIIVIVFALFLTMVPLASFVMPDYAKSAVERRSLAQWLSYGEYRERNPGSTLSDYFESLEQYLLDQFPMRDDVRTISALSRRYLMRQLDQDRFVKLKGHLGKLDFTYREHVVDRAIKLFNSVYDDHFCGGKGKHLFALIPDKMQHMVGGSVYPVVDTGLFMRDLKGRMSHEIEVMSLENEMSLDMYYRTDPHWNQRHLLPIADALLNYLDHSIRVSDNSFEVRSLGPFYGTYAGQAALPIGADELVYFDHPSIRHARVYDPITKEETTVYHFDRQDSIDPYDLYLGGAKPLLAIKNDHAAEDRKLVVFRDSFGSSLVPLLIPYYSEILVVDLRYVRAEAIGNEFAQYRDADLVFLYSTTILNAPGAFPIS